MKRVPDHGICRFIDSSVIEDFKIALKSAFRNSDLTDVTVNKVSDEVIVVFEWARNDSDLEVSNAITKHVVMDFNGEYIPNGN